MHWTASSVNRILTSINELRHQCADKCDALKATSTARGFQLTSQISPAKVSGVVAAVDSGFSTRQFVSLDVMLLRSVAAIFTYAENSLLACEYFPNRVPGISLHYGVFPDQTESSCFKSLTRLNAELACAIQVVKIHSPSTLLLDGSILPLPSDKPPQGALSPLFEEVISRYEELYTTCIEANCAIVGVVKDSRSQRMCNLLEKMLEVNLPVNSDEFLADLLLASGQRTFAFPFSSEPTGVSWGKNVNCFYLKSGEGLPYRVEFIVKPGDAGTVSAKVEQFADAVASQLYSLGAPQFSYPSILIEVDLRAGLTPGEISALFSSIEHNRRLVLRSNSRPFR